MIKVSAQEKTITAKIITNAFGKFFICLSIGFRAGHWIYGIRGVVNSFLRDLNYGKAQVNQVLRSRMGIRRLSVITAIM